MRSLLLKLVCLLTGFHCLAEGYFQCLDPLPGTENRSAVTLRIARQPWDSHAVVSSVAEIVLREFLGFNVVLVHSAAANQWGPDLVSGLYDIDMEQWNFQIGTAQYEQYVTMTREVLQAGAIGYSGRSGLYTFSAVVATNPMADYFKFYQNASRVKEAGFPRFADSMLRAVLGDAFPACNEEHASWCGTGALDGYWAPTVCESEPDPCVEFYKGSPLQDEGYFEQLVEQNGLQAVIGYYGDSLFTLLKQRESQPVVFYATRPSLLVAAMDVARISFPDFLFGCDSIDTGNPDTGTTSCDRQEKRLMKLANRHLLEVAPEAFYFLTLMEMDLEHIESTLVTLQAAGGVYATTFEAACSYVQSNTALFHRFAPACITNPTTMTQGEVQRFNVNLLVCENVTIYPAMEPSFCPMGTLGTVNRSSVTIRLARRNWLTHTMLSIIAEVLFRDYLGFTVVPHYFSTSQITWVEEVLAGEYDIDMEVWMRELDVIASFIESGDIVFAGFVGFIAREGIYVPQLAVQQNWRADYYKFFQNSTAASAAGFVKFENSRLKEVRNESLCDPLIYPWCGTGQLEGFWAPPACQTSPGNCIEFIHGFPFWSATKVEQLIVNLNLEVVVGYYGYEMWNLLPTYEEQGINYMYYWWAPDVFNYRVAASLQVAFPDHTMHCDAELAINPTGPIMCDFDQQRVMKMASPRLVSEAQEANYVLQRIQMLQSDLDELMPLHEAAGGNLSSLEVTCEFFSRNMARLREWAPDCMVAPPLPELIRVNDSVFSQEEGSCMPVVCSPREIIVYDSQQRQFECRLCPPGEVPDEIQRECVRCAVGERVDANGSLCVPCSIGQYSLAGSSVCQACDTGRYTAYAGMSTCEACPLGRFQNLTGQGGCVNCPKGRAASEKQLALCSSCELGTAAGTEGLSACTQCSEGTFQGSTGSTACDGCVAGYFAFEPASSACSLCFPGFYQEDARATSCNRCPAGSYAALQGATECEECTLGRTLTAAANSESDCQCPAGSFLFNTSSTRRCVTCDAEYMEPCLGGDNPAMQKEGYFITVDGADIYRCASKDACPMNLLGKCPTGSEGIGCADCKDGDYVWDGERCARCSAVDGFSVVVMPLGFVVVFGLVFKYGNDPIGHRLSLLSEFLILVGLTTNVFLYMNSFAGIDVEWEEPIKSVFEICKFILREATRFHVSCSVKFGEVQSYAFTCLMPPIVAVCFVLLAATGVIRWQKLFNTFSTITYALYLVLVLHGLKPFRYIVHPKGNKSVLDMPSVFEGSSDHAGLVVFGVLDLLLYCIPFAAACCYASYRIGTTKANSKRRWWLTTFRFLFYKFQPEYYFWGVLILLRNACFALAPSLAPEVPKISVFVLSFVASASVAATSLACPWRHAWMTIVDVIILCYILLVLNLAAGWVRVNDGADTFVANLLVSVGIIAVTVGCFFALRLLMAITCASEEKLEEARSKTVEKEEKYSEMYLDVLRHARHASAAQFFRDPRLEIADAYDMLSLEFSGTLHKASSHGFTRVPRPLLNIAREETHVALLADIATSMSSASYSLHDFYEDCCKAFPELKLYNLDDMERADAQEMLVGGRTRADEQQRTIGALFSVYALCRLDIDGKEVMSFGVDQDKRYRVNGPPADAQRDALKDIPWPKMTPEQRRANFYWNFDWELMRKLFIQAGIFYFDSHGKLVLDSAPDGRLVAMLSLTAYHDIMKDSSLWPTVAGEPYEAYKVGETIQDHDIALAYILDRHADVLPSFRILTLAQQRLIRFTQSEMGFNAGWLVQAEGPPSIVLRKLKAAIESGGAEAPDVAFYFVHWVTDLAGAEPTPFTGSEKFAAKFPPFVLQGLLGCFSIVKMLADSSETEVYEEYLRQRWLAAHGVNGEGTQDDANSIPSGEDAIARMRLLCMAQGGASSVLEAFDRLPDAEKSYLSLELSATGLPGQRYSSCEPQQGPEAGTPFLLYYGPAWCQRLGQSDPDLVLKVILLVFKLAREAYPESLDMAIDQKNDISCRTLQLGLLKTIELDSLHALFESSVGDSSGVLNFMVRRDTRLEGTLHDIQAYSI